MDRSFRSLTDEDQEIYKLHAKGIDKNVRKAFPSIPANFTLKPVTIRTTIGCGMFYDFKMALPDGQFAKVSFHAGGHPMPQIGGGEEEKKEHIYNVDPTPSSSNDD